MRNLRHFTLALVILSIFALTDRAISATFPWAGHYKNSDLGFWIDIDDRGYLNTNIWKDLDSEFPNPRHTLTGATYKTIGYYTSSNPYDPCRYPTNVEVGYDKELQILHFELSFVTASSGCRPLRSVVYYADFVKDNSDKRE